MPLRRRRRSDGGATEEVAPSLFISPSTKSPVESSYSGSACRRKPATRLRITPIRAKAKPRPQRPHRVLNSDLHHRRITQSE